ncbi:MAG: ribonuclease J [Eubacteriales bacterium]|nr:ribonuclease J [Eubacteriales bacterium]
MKKKQIEERVKIIPLGGLDQIGMNITLFEYKNDIIIIDCGLAFPDEEMLGIDIVIPDFSYLKQNADRVRGLIVTHGHEDHIGAIPYLLKELNVPIYGSRLTLGLVGNKLKEHKILEQCKLKSVGMGQSVRLGKFRTEFIRTNHSIPDAAAIAIHTPVGVIVHSGDFKVDYTPIYGKAIDMHRLAELGREGVLALMADSTNVLREGYTMSESTVGKSFDTIFNENKGRRLIVATFASNVDRVQQIINSAKAHRRKVAVEGRSMVNVVTTAQELGYIKMPKNMLISSDEIDNYKDSQIVIITTGSQGEPLSALSRIANNTHRKISIKEGDVVILSSKPIPGNEKYVARVINSLCKKGADVVYEDTHVSGHACREELKLLHTLVHPKYFIPVHGEYQHLKAHQDLAVELGMQKKDVYILENGNVFALGQDGGEVVDKVSVETVLVDGLGVGDVGEVVLRDRQKLSQDGLIVVSIAVNKYTNEILSNPEIISRGFTFVKENTSLMEDIRETVHRSLDKANAKNINDWTKIKTLIRDDIREYLWFQLKRSPMVLPILMQVEC